MLDVGELLLDVPQRVFEISAFYDVAEAAIPAPAISVRWKFELFQARDESQEALFLTQRPKTRISQLRNTC